MKGASQLLTMLVGFLHVGLVISAVFYSYSFVDSIYMRYLMWVILISVKKKNNQLGWELEDPLSPPEHGASRLRIYLSLGDWQMELYE